MHFPDVSHSHRLSAARLLCIGFSLLLGSLANAGEVPADSLLNRDLGFLQRAILRPIVRWQEFSYATPAYHCQFEPSCSHFMALAVAEKGVLPGIIMGTDRILRCNPAASDYHQLGADPRLTPDGRLYEPLDYPAVLTPKRSPALAATLSVMPGLGRCYAGRPLDGLLSFLMVASFGYSTLRHAEADHPAWVAFNGSLTLLFWSADFYGAWWSAAHHQAP